MASPRRFWVWTSIVKAGARNLAAGVPTWAIFLRLQFWNQQHRSWSCRLHNLGSPRFVPVAVAGLHFADAQVLLPSSRSCLPISQLGARVRDECQHAFGDEVSSDVSSSGCPFRTAGKTVRTENNIVVHITKQSTGDVELPVLAPCMTVAEPAPCL